MSLAASCLPPFLALSFLFSIPSPSSSHSFASLPISAGSLTYFPHPCKGRGDHDVRSDEDDRYLAAATYTRRVIVSAVAEVY